MEHDTLPPVYILETYEDRERLVQQFALFRSGVEEWFQRTLAWGMLPNSSSHARWHCLDVGCGEGLYLAHFAQSYPVARFVGFDKDVEAVLTANMTFVAGNETHRHIVQHDALAPLSATLPTEDPFDMAYAIISLIHTQSAQQSLAHIADALRPGGMLYIRELIVPPMFTFPSPALMEIVRVTTQALQALGDPAYSLQVAEALAATGFAVLESAPETYLLGGPTRAGQIALAVVRGAMRSARRAVVERCHVITAAEYTALEAQVEAEMHPEKVGAWTVSNTIARKLG